MPSRILYQIPFATWPFRLAIAAICLIVVVTICGWWLPRLTRHLRGLFARSRAMAVFGIAVAMLSVVIAVVMLGLLIAVIKNPQAYVTDVGVTKENVFSRQPTSIAWDEIRQVYCRGEGTIESIEILAKDGRGISLGNTGGADFDSMYELFENQLGPSVVKSCDLLRKS
jgi:hypothetical protein